MEDSKKTAEENQHLKTKLNEAEQEIKRLKEELAALKSKPSPTAIPADASPQKIKDLEAKLAEATAL